MSFSDLGLEPELTRAVADKGYDTPTPIQLQAIPAVLEGRDVLAGAQTGTGKTAGFVLPLLQKLGHSRGRAPRVLVLTPTRELAAQVAQSATDYGAHKNLRTLAWFGGFRCLLGPGSVDPYNPKVVRASMGAIFHVPIEIDVALDSLPGRFGRIACLDMAGERLRSTRLGKCDCFVFGNEARGLPPASVDSLGAEAFTVPGCGAIDSLNLASVVNMCVYELNR